MTIADELEKRLRDAFNKTDYLKKAHDNALTVINEDVRDIGLIKDALKEIVCAVEGVQDDMLALSLHLREEGIVTTDLRNKLAQDATLMINFVDVFMRNDHLLIKQLLEIADTSALQKALFLMSYDRLETVSLAIDRVKNTKVQ